MDFSSPSPVHSADRSSGRWNQKQRTRQALIDAAFAMARDGRPLTIADVAAVAMVSTATAYRYFPNPQSLWAELALYNTGTPTPEQVLADAPDDPAARLDAVVSRVAEFQLADEVTWRTALRAILERWSAQTTLPADERVPIRGESRMEMTRLALAGLADRLPPELHRKLTMAVMLVYGVEAMVAARDTCGLDSEEATEVMRWAAQALVRTAVEEAAHPPQS